ncbi:hypothetical protein [Novipirellula herctigrandis]
MNDSTDGAECADSPGTFLYDQRCGRANRRWPMAFSAAPENP